MNAFEVVLRTVVVLLLLVGGVAAEEGVPGERTLVLRSGTEVTVRTAKLAGEQVLVTFADGRMLAYAAEDVDLEASGLSATVDPAADAPGTAEPGPPPGVFGSATARSGESRMRITDDDVEHVEPGTSGPEAEAAAGPAVTSGEAFFAPFGPVRITRAGFAVMDDVVRVDGSVENRSGSVARGLLLTAIVVGTDGKEVARGRTTLGDPLADGAVVRFGIEVPVAVPIQSVRVVVGDGGPEPEPPAPARNETSAE